MVNIYTCKQKFINKLNLRRGDFLYICTLIRYIKNYTITKIIIVNIYKVNYVSESHKYIIKKILTSIFIES